MTRRKEANVAGAVVAGDSLVGPIGTAGRAEIEVPGTTTGAVCGYALDADTILVEGWLREDRFYGVYDITGEVLSKGPVRAEVELRGQLIDALVAYHLAVSELERLTGTPLDTHENMQQAAHQLMIDLDLDFAIKRDADGCIEGGAIVRALSYDRNYLP